MIIQKARVSLELTDFHFEFSTGKSISVGKSSKEEGDAPNLCPLSTALAAAVARQGSGLQLLARAVAKASPPRSRKLAAVKAFADAAEAFLKACGE